MKYLCFIFLVLIATQNGTAQQKEVVIIGTMHQVPNLVKNSYKPLLRYVKRYNPQAIYTETVMPSDTISLLNDSPKFLHKSDSVKLIFTQDEQRFERLMSEDLEGFSSEDFGFMATSFLVKRNYANYRYYNYLSTYGNKGSKKPLGNENHDLSARLAIHLNLKYLHSMDDQQNRKEYEEAWKDCMETGAENGDNQISNEINKKIFKSAVVPALIGRFGKHTNKVKSLERFHKVNSFRYVTQPHPSCDAATKYWDLRNKNMVRNVAEQVLEQEHVRNIVIVGAGHVIGMKEAFERDYPNIKVRIMFN